MEECEMTETTNATSVCIPKPCRRGCMSQIMLKPAANHETMESAGDVDAGVLFKAPNLSPMSMKAARYSPRHQPDGTFILRSELIDPTMQTHVINVRIVYHIMCPIYRPGSSVPLAASDRAGFKEYLEYLTTKMNDAGNCRTEDFDGADFDNHRLFSVRRNRSVENARDNQQTYLQLKHFCRRLNVLFHVQHEECDYVPDWDDFNSPALDETYKARLRNSLDMNYREWVDPVVKGFQRNPRTGRYDLPTGLGVPAKNPDKALHVWVVEFSGQYFRYNRECTHRLTQEEDKQTG